MRLKDRRILITGGASGIGLETAALFGEQGARVAILDRNPEALARAAARLPAIVALQTDVADEDAVNAAVAEAAQRLGGLDGVVNCAGIGTRRTFDETTLAIMRNDLAINLLGPFLIAKAAVPHLRHAGGGTIVNTASGIALRPTPGKVAYGASKGGLIVMTKAMGIDLAADNIRVNVVCPGIIDTPLIASDANGPTYTPEQLKSLMDRRLIRRFGMAREVADAMLYLTSHESSYVTATVLAVDGGGTMH